MQYYCTYFDRNYLSRGLALYESLSLHTDKLMLFVLCLDDETFTLLSRCGYKNIYLIPLSKLEERFPELLAVKPSRSLIEYYFTCSPCLPLYILENQQNIDHVIYLDADLFCYSDTLQMLEEISIASIAVVEHRFFHFRKKNLQYGRFNVGILFFRRDDEGLTCLKHWKNQCIEWCYDHVEPERFADQKYLDDWPSKYGSLKIIENKGVNLAPWNVSGECLRSRDGKIYVGQDKLVFYHFHGLKRIESRRWDTGLSYHLVACRGILRKDIYLPYIKKLIQIESQLLETYAFKAPETQMRNGLYNGFMGKLGSKIQHVMKIIFRSFIRIT